MKAFFVTIPHSGEKVPDQAVWLKGLDEATLMCDVDRYVDRLYDSSLAALHVPVIKTQWHRYAGDLNRLPSDVDASTVIGDLNPAGKFSRGFLWRVTTTQKVLMSEPINPRTHAELVELIYKPFHQLVQNKYEEYKALGTKTVYHLDAHSMPSLGTSEHRDPGEYRAEIVVSDCLGKSCSKEYLNLVVRSYEQAGFQVKMNWPYFGGRVSEQYGRPELGQEAIQVEMNRALYMDEVTKKYLPEQAAQVQNKIAVALRLITEGLPEIEGKV